MAGRAGSGKSAVARHMAQQPQVEWIDLDKVAWGTYAMGTSVYDRLIGAFGKAILDSSGEINRLQLAEAAFASEESQKLLNVIVHPAVSEEVKRLIRVHRGMDTELLLVEGALLASSPYVDRSDFDLIVWLDVPEDIRAKRLRDAGRSAHTHRGNETSPTGEHVPVPADGTVKTVASRILRTILGK
ncbi:dephospho-CoA kinase [Candidatus Bipolaricaulota bacterium]